MHDNNRVKEQVEPGQKNDPDFWETETTFQSIADSTPDAIIIANSKRKIVYCNKTAQKLFGYRKEELTGKSTLILMPQSTRRPEENNRDKFLEKGISHVMETTSEYVGLKKDGTAFPVEISHSSVRLKPEPFYIAIIRDITKRKQAEEELQKTKEYLEKIFDTSADGIIATDSMGYITKTNTSVKDITGYSGKELMGKHASELVYCPHENSRRTATSRSIVRKHGIVYQYESLWQRKNSSTYPVETQITLTMDKDGNESGGLIVIRDITRRKKREEELREAKEGLEKHVKKRTAELLKTNKQLEHSKNELKTKTESLKELNTALRIMLDRRSEDVEDVGEKILVNVTELVTPYIEKIKDTNLNSRQLSYTNILESNLSDILSPFLQKLSRRLINLTPTEIKVANFIKQGKRTKEIAEIMGLSKRTIDFYRENIRKKLGLNREKTNLASFLMSLQ